MSQKKILLKIKFNSVKLSKKSEKNSSRKKIIDIIEMLF